MQAKIKIIVWLLLLVPLIAQIDYNSQIQPIFDDRCINCHGSMGGLNLTSYENLMEGGLSGDEVIPYDHGSSSLWIRVNSGQMPPGNNDLTDDQVDLIAQWIDEGALPETSTSSCDEGYTYFADIPDNVTVLDQSNCFANSNLNVLNGLITLNTLNYSSPLEVGVQTWLGNSLYKWIAEYTQNGVNGVNEQLTELPENIGELSGLKQLYLEWNKLTSLPDSFTQLSSLENLAISNNLLISLPSNFGDLSELEFVDLGYNQLTEIPESIGNLKNIEYLWLFNNQLSSLPESIFNLQINWSDLDFNNYPYFAIGGNLLCDPDSIPCCVLTSDNFIISLDQFYYSFLIETLQSCSDGSFYSGQNSGGDLNGDDMWNILDIVNLASCVLNDLEYSCTADITMDGTVNVLDIVNLANCVLALSCGEG